MESCKTGSCESIKTNLKVVFIIKKNEASTKIMINDNIKTAINKKNKTRTKTILAIVFITAILLVTYQFAPRSGWQGDGTPLYTIAEGRVKGGVYVDGGHGLTYENPYQEYFEVPDGVVTYARLYIPVWNFDQGDTMDVTVNGNILKSSKPDYLAAWGIANYCCNVTGYVQSGLNEVAVNFDNPGGGPYCVLLVAVYENPDMPPVRFWINEGNYALAYSSKTDSTNTIFSDTFPGKNAVLYTLMIAGTENEIDELYFDSELIGSDVGRSKSGKYFDLDMFEVKISEEESTLSFKRGDEGYLHPMAAVLVLESETGSDYIQIHEQQAVSGESVPVSVIAVCLIVILAVIIRYLMSGLPGRKP